MLDDLRQAALEQDDEPIASHRTAVSQVQEDRLFGMTSLECMFVSIGLFGLTLVGSILLLVATESIVFNF